MGRTAEKDEAAGLSNCASSQRYDLCTGFCHLTAVGHCFPYFAAQRMDKPENLPYSGIIGSRINPAKRGILYQAANYHVTVYPPFHPTER